MYVLETYQTVLLYTQFLLLNNRKVKNVERGRNGREMEESWPRAGHRANREIGRSCTCLADRNHIIVRRSVFFFANGGV